MSRETMSREQSFADQLAMTSLVTQKCHKSPHSYAFSDITANFKGQDYKRWGSQSENNFKIKSISCLKKVF